MVTPGTVALGLNGEGGGFGLSFEQLIWQYWKKLPRQFRIDFEKDPRNSLPIIPLVLRLYRHSNIAQPKHLQYQQETIRIE